MEQQINNENNAGNDTANTNKTKQTNREYKSRLFSYIFGREETKDRTLSLYNSLNGTNYTNPDDITITTIEDVIYMGMKNDLSYIVSDRASLYSAININEHQSTENPNMPLREFMYAAKLYDKYLKIKKKNPYSSTIIPLPIPKLVVLHNGKTDVPDEYELKEQLLAHRAEVIGMWINEYNEEETMQMFKEEGRQEGENLLATLINKLISLGRNEDITKVTTDQAFRENLYIQFGLKKSM